MSYPAQGTKKKNTNAVGIPPKGSETAQTKTLPVRSEVLPDPKPPVQVVSQPINSALASESRPMAVNTPSGGRPSLASSKLRSTVDLETVVFNPKNTSQSADNEPALPSYSDAFTFEAAQRALFAFADERDNETLKVMLKRNFELDGLTFKLQLDNQIQMDALTQLKQDLATHLRQQLRNAGIQIAADIVESTTDRRPYTAQEKFEYLANKNPALLELRDKLGLELVF